jgi:hypothetical protein
MRRMVVGSGGSNLGRGTAERTSRVRRAIVGLVVLLAGTAGIQLFLLADSTATTFAWTVAPPLAAAFMGAVFWAGAVAAATGYRGTDWREISILLPAATIFTTLVFLATLLHLDRFHFGADQLLTAGFAWAWLGVYVIVPPLFAFFWRAELQRRGAGGPTSSRGRGDGARVPYSTAIRGASGLIAAALFGVAVVQFLSPGTLPWPWALTALTSRMNAAFLAGVAAALLAIAVENDAGRLRVTAIFLVTFGVLELLAILRFSSNVTSGAVVSWAWAGLLVVITVLAAAVLRARNGGRGR